MENKVLYSYGRNWRRPVTGLPGPNQTKFDATWFDSVRASALGPLTQIMSRFGQDAGFTNQKLCNILLGPFSPYNESVVYIYVHIMLVILKTTQRRELTSNLRRELHMHIMWWDGNLFKGGFGEIRLGWNPEAKPHLILPGIFVSVPSQKYFTVRYWIFASDIHALFHSH